MSFLQRSWNVGNLLMVVGVVALGITFWVPYATASRVARVESRAERCARGLKQLSVERSPLRFDEPAASDDLLAAFPDDYGTRLAVVRPGDVKAPPQRALYFVGKHYCYLVTVAPTTRPAETPAPKPKEAIEVYAWPRTFLGSGRTAFYFPENGEAAYTRNLHARYAGFSVVPRAGCGQAHPGSVQTPQGSYRGMDDEHWLPLPAR